VRLVAYYALFFAIVTTIANVFPALPEALSRERARHVMAGVPTDAAAADRIAEMDRLYPASSELVAVVGASMCVALALSLPVAWVYGWTSRKKVYSRSFAQSMVVFPIAVALVVFLVKGSLALAFSLAGIVAAVRFRSPLPETRDAVYLFLVIGIGLAVGVQLVVVAILASVIFNTTMIAISVTDFGARPRRMSGFQLEPRKSGGVEAPPESGVGGESRG